MRKKGAIVTMVALSLALLFPAIQFTVIDLGRLHLLRENLKFDLQMATAAAVNTIDWENTYTGDFLLSLDHADVRNNPCNSAPKALYKTLVQNIEPSFIDDIAGFQYLGSFGNIRAYGGTIGQVQYYAEIYNGLVPATIGGNNIPSGLVPSAAQRAALTLSVTKPTVFLIAKRAYTPTLLNILTPNANMLNLVQYASAELRSSDYEDN